MIPPTAVSAVTSVLWVKDVQMAHAQLLRAQPIVMAYLSLVFHQAPPTVASVVWPVHQVYPADMAVA